MRLFTSAFATQFGKLRLIAGEDALCGLLLPGEEPPDKNSLPGNWTEASDCPEHPLLREARDQVLAYLHGSRRVFDLPLDPQGTPFQKMVWRELLAIPYGQTSTYGELAAKIGGKNKARAVGGAAHHNPIALIIPCHRLIGTGGKLVGFGGGLPLKQALLDLEQDFCRQVGAPIGRP